VIGDFAYDNLFAVKMFDNIAIVGVADGFNIDANNNVFNGVIVAYVVAAGVVVFVAPHIDFDAVLDVIFVWILLL
jgi:hypothetical protein